MTRYDSHIFRDPSKLTALEEEVHRLMKEGKNKHEIIALTGKKQSTIEKYLVRIKEKVAGQQAGTEQ